MLLMDRAWRNPARYYARAKPANSYTELRERDRTKGVGYRGYVLLGRSLPAHRAERFMCAFDFLESE